MSLNFTLRRANHAIGEFTASIQLHEAVSQIVFADVITALRQVALNLDLPAAISIPVFQFLVGQLPAGSTSVPPNIPGAGFQRFAKTGEIEASLLCQPNSIVFTLRDYTNWASELPKLLDMFEPLIRIYAVEVPAIQSVTLQYLNEFQSSGTLNTAELFKPGAKWLPKFGLESDQPWHSHNGRFFPVEGNVKRLVNVNCDTSHNYNVQDSTHYCNVKLLIFAGRYFNVPGSIPLIIDMDHCREILSSNFNDAHDHEKSILRDVLSDAYLEQIGASNVN